jgi:hypothetical protein
MSYESIRSLRASPCGFFSKAFSIDRISRYDEYESHHPSKPFTLITSRMTVDTASNTALRSVVACGTAAKW